MVKLIDNEYISQQSHCDQLVDLLTDAVELDWMVAFAKKTGFDLVENSLGAALSSGNLRRARFIFGLDFYQTDPWLLRKILEISENYPGRVTLYITNDGFVGGHQNEDDGEDANEDDRNYLTFHPKLYSFLYADKSYRVMVGSANLTGGGLESNHELSMLLKLDGPRTFPGKVIEYIDNLVNDGKIVPATVALIDNYAERHRIYRTYIKNAKKKFSTKGNKTSKQYDRFDELRTRLDTMKMDKTPNGFLQQIDERKNYRASAIKEIDSIGGLIFNGDSTSNRLSFLKYYGNLIGQVTGKNGSKNSYWRSSELQRGYNSVAKCYMNFQEGYTKFIAADVASGNTLAPQDAYDSLMKNGFVNVKGAGPNVITEILHTYNNERFAVMNGNSVNAVDLANFGTKYTSQSGTPLEKSYVGKNKLYGKFCDEVSQICKALSLSNFTEFDALGNYIYFT